MTQGTVLAGLAERTEPLLLGGRPGVRVRTGCARQYDAA
jgi:hypothetical protein